MTAAIYCRLSREDGEKQGESESIQNQKAMLQSYAAAHGWQVEAVFCDEDYSGVDRERPAFRALLSQAEEHRFDIVLCKTQSRFTRDMELVERYIHGKFSEWGIRFVAAVENADTALQGNKKARQINGLVNEWYLEDLSENIRAVLDHKRRTGEYIGAFPLYGYRRAPGAKNRLEIDPEAAQTVLEIFRLCLNGSGRSRIAQILNEQGVLCPAAYKQAQGLGYRNGAQHSGSRPLWNRTTVGRMLHERMYTGDLVQGRRKKASYKSKKLLQQPESEWMIVSDAHEAIVSRAVFEEAQRLLSARTRRCADGVPHLLAGKVRCLLCKSRMEKVSCGTGEHRRSYLRCGSGCKGQSVRLDHLETAVLSLLQAHVAVAVDDNFLKKLFSDTTPPLSDREQINLSGEIVRREQALHDLYLDRVQGLVSPAQFAALSRVFWEESEQLREKACCLARRENLQQADANVSNENLLQKLFQCDEFLRACLANCLEEVEIGEKIDSAAERKLLIRWRF